MELLRADVAAVHGGVLMPWALLSSLAENLRHVIDTLGDEYTVTDGVAVHRTACIDSSASTKAPVIIGPGCFVGPHTLLRGGVWLTDGVRVGPGAEIARSVIGKHTALAHFNFVGDSIIGNNVNMEAGAVIANHYNERADKMIDVLLDGRRVHTGVSKFGALVGDGCKIGANAVLTPGTILLPATVVARLELVNQTS